MKKIKTTLKYIVVCLLVARSLVGCAIGQNTANDSTTAAIEAQDITENPDARDKDSQPDAQSENGLPRAIQKKRIHLCMTRTCIRQRLRIH